MRLPYIRVHVNEIVTRFNYIYIPNVLDLYRNNPIRDKTVFNVNIENYVLGQFLNLSRWSKQDIKYFEYYMTGGITPGDLDLQKYYLNDDKFADVMNELYHFVYLPNEQSNLSLFDLLLNKFKCVYIEASERIHTEMKGPYSSITHSGMDFLYYVPTELINGIAGPYSFDVEVLSYA